jgi:hypothetical protein
MGRIENCLGIGDVVDSGHRAVFDAKTLVNNLYHRSRQLVVQDAALTIG